MKLINNVTNIRNLSTLKIACLTYYQIGTNPCSKVIEMCRALASLNLSVTLFTTSDHAHLRINQYKLNNVNFIEFPDLLWGRLRQGIDLFNMLLRFCFLLKDNFDLIHLIDCRPVNSLPAIYIKKIKKTPLVISWWDLFSSGGSAKERSGRIYSNTIRKIESFFDLNFRKYADKSIVVTDYLWKKLISMKYPHSDIRKLYIGIDRSYQLKVNKNDLRKALSLPCGEKIFCITGTLFKNDMNLLIDTLTDLKKRVERMPKTLVIGNKNILSRPSLNIKSIGTLKTIGEVYQYMTACDFGLVPMRKSIANKARWPSKVSDYLSAGLPIVTTPISDFQLIFSRIDIGYISLGDDPIELADVIIMAINADRLTYEQKKNSALKFSQDELDWIVISKKIFNLYYECFYSILKRK